MATVEDHITNGKKPARRWKLVLIVCLFIGIIGVVAAKLYGGDIYRGISQDIISQDGNSCGDSHGMGHIVSVDSDAFTIERNDGTDQIVRVTDQTKIKSSTGSDSISDLKPQDGVAIVGKSNPDGSEAATAVLVCSAKN